MGILEAIDTLESEQTPETIPWVVTLLKNYTQALTKEESEQQTELKQYLETLEDLLENDSNSFKKKSLDCEKVL